MKFNFILIALILILGSCHSSKQIANKGETEVIEPCSGGDFYSTNEAFRASAVGISNNQTMAKNMAMAEARKILAQTIETKVNDVTQNYASNYVSGDKGEGAQKMETMTRQITSQTLKGVTPICQKIFKTNEGTYKAYICLELSGSDVLNSLSNSLRNDEKLKMDFKEDLFKQTFEAEMKKFEESRN